MLPTEHFFECATNRINASGSSYLARPKPGEVQLGLRMEGRRHLVPPLHAHGYGKRVP
jgi:hypothetical protein